MKPVTADDLAHLAGDLDLVPSGPLAEALAEAVDGTAESCGRALVRRELLTRFQLDRLLRGERRGFFFGRAKLLYQIGAGSFASVYRAIHRDTGGILAVKVLRSRYANDPDKCRAFRHEGKMGQMLRHPNIVAIDEVGEEAGSSYITMEFVEGQTLRELVGIRGAVDVETSLDLIGQMAAALEYAHGRGVTHRDMKASNVLVSSTGQAKLVDFGLAGVDDTGDRSLGRLDQPRTIDYATLEKLTGMKDDAVRSDIYFLGTVSYLLVAGTPALPETRDRNERSNPRRFETVVPLAKRCPDLPRDLADLVDRMMRLDPLERWQTAAEIRRRAEAIRSGGNGAAAGPAATVAAAAEPARKGTVMLVESSEKGQQILREFLGKLGYRVLVTQSPQRALTRFASIPAPADCLVVSTLTLGEEAVAVFNGLAGDEQLAAVPAVLLLGAKQRDLKPLARGDDRRRVVQMPVPGQEMGELLSELVGVHR